MKFDTVVEKGIHGWIAKTLISEIPGTDKILKVYTMKRYSGEVNSDIIGCSMTKGGGIMYTPTDDYDGGTTPHSIKRVTEKAIRQAHYEVLEPIQIEGLNNPIIKQMIEHYKVEE